MAEIEKFLARHIFVVGNRAAEFLCKSTCDVSAHRSIVDRGETAQCY
jgi:hypothetical protein